MSKAVAVKEVQSPKIESVGATKRVNTTQSQPVVVEEVKDVPANTEIELKPDIDTDMEAQTEKPEAVAIEEKQTTEVKQESEQKQVTEQKPLTREEIKALYEKEFPTEANLTDEQRSQKELETEKRMLDLYVAKGGKIDDFLIIKQTAQRDLADLSKAELTRELKEKGFNDDQIKAIQVERYYQINPDELEQDDDESDEEYEARKELIKKKVEFGTEKLNNRSLHLKTKAQQILDNLKAGISQQDLEKQAEVEFIAKIDEASKALPRKLNLQLGKLNNEDLGSVEIDVPENDISEISAMLKDSAKRNQILYNEDGSYNVARITDLLLKERMLEKATREGLLEGQTRQVRIFEKTFPIRNPHALGIGGSQSTNPNAAKGKVAAFGKPQRMTVGQR